MKPFFAVCALFIFALSIGVYASPANPKKAAAMAPNIDISTYRRCYAANEKVEINLQAFNLRSVSFTAYRLDLSKVVQNSSVMDDFAKTEDKMDLSRLSAAATWKAKTSTTYIDSWVNVASNVPKLSPGTYLIVAKGNGVEKRTWLAVTNASLLVKRSSSELMIYAADIVTGAPISNVDLSIYGKGSRLALCRTSADGVARIQLVTKGNIWIDGNSDRGPLFAISGEVQPPDPYVIYTITDRPIYRPGATIQFKATLRKWVSSPTSPGRFLYQPYSNSAAVIEFRDSTDLLVERRTVTTNSYGSLNGAFDLAQECGQGDWHVNVIVGGYTSYSTFTVQSYRKPEMTVSFSFDKQRYICGSKAHAVLDAQYVYGRPVVGASVKYTVNYNSGAGSYDSAGTTDNSGHLLLDIPTKRLPTDQNLTVNATVTDLSRRTYTAEADTLIAAGEFRLSLTSDKDVYKTGSKITTTVDATDYDGHPVPAQVKVTMTETKQDNQHRTYNEYTVKNIMIGSSGEGKAVFSCPRPGTLDFNAVAYDRQNDKISDEISVDVSDKEPVPPQSSTPPSLELIANKTSYEPGETAKIKVNTTLVGIKYTPATKDNPEQPAHADAWALVTVEGEQLGPVWVQHLTSKNSLLTVPLAAVDFPSVALHVEVIEDHTVTDQEITLPVNRKQQQLTVNVAPDKTTYQPGDMATYSITTKDWQNNPVSADLSFDVVDESIYDIKEDSSPDIEQYFYSGQNIRIETDFSFAAQYSGGGFQNAGGLAVPSAPGAAGIRVRRNFADTAYWDSDVITDSDGKAVVTFPVPDNLTIWRATAHAISKQTAVGTAKNRVISVMPLLVKLEMPRFLIQGDKSVFSAVIQNGTQIPRTVKVSATASGAELTGDTQTTVELPAGGQQRLDWPASILGPDRAIFDVVADGGTGAQDAAESTLPVLPSAFKVVTVDSDQLSSAKTAESISLSSLTPGSGLKLTLSSSLAGSIADSVKELITRPEGDTECTASALSADVTAAEALSATGKKTDRNVQNDVSLALQKLYHYQHPDGGWNWWEFDQTDGDITASVLDALETAKSAGYAVDEQCILRGMTSLSNQLTGEQDPDSRASWLNTLARTNRYNSAPLLEKLVQTQDQLDDYGKASLVLGLLDDRNKNDHELAETVLTGLLKDCIQEGRTASWPARAGICPWENDDVAVTAHVLQALLQAQPKSPLIPGAVHWLMANKGSVDWYVSAADNLAISALSNYLTQTGDSTSHFTSAVSLDGQVLSTLQSDGAAQSLTVTLTPSQLSGHKSVEISETGTGTVYIDKEIDSEVPINQAAPQSAGISIDRHFVLALTDPSKPLDIPSGTSVTVKLDITADAPYRYVQIEDALPAGCEIADTDNGTTGYPIDYSDGPISYANEDVSDNRVVFSFDSLPQGRTSISYQINTEQPGLYTICPSIASLSYFPEVRGNSAFAHISIVDQP